MCHATNGCVQQEKLLCNCCKIRESDWCMLLDSVKIKSIHQLGSRILQQLQSSFLCWTQPMKRPLMTRSVAPPTTKFSLHVDSSSLLPPLLPSSFRRPGTGVTGVHASVRTEFMGLWSIVRNHRRVSSQFHKNNDVFSRWFFSSFFSHREAGNPA